MRKTSAAHCLRLIPFVVLLLFYFPVSYAASLAWAESPPARHPGKPQPALVEVVFVLDTTGSMNDLIDAAKTKIWSIANTLASADPSPEIRMGLVGYRDRGDAYVTALTPLSQDLDAVYADLMKFRADGGGDTPESVNQALYEAVTRSPWSPTERKAYRAIFLVGDAPPQMNYSNDVRYAESCRLAAGRGIVINTIQCGDLAETTPVWKEIARLGEGEYFHVAQSGSAVLYDTPFDEKIAGLSKELDDTRIYYGSAAEMAESESRRKTADSIYASAKPAAVAQRTVFNASAAGKKNFSGSQELVQDVTSGQVDVSRIEKSELPEELQKMKPADLKRLIAERSEKRKVLQTQIGELSKKRQAYIQAKVQEDKGAGTQSLDAKVFKCIKSQTRDQGMTYEGGPVY
ncbi:MAG: VWA domain-containing protein [Desulfosarcinaceae bacterium]